MKKVSLIVRSAAGRWGEILPALGIELPHHNKHGACPKCGGKDRFRFDDKNGRGTWFCNQCGSGDGLDLVGLVRGENPSQAAEQVANIVGSVLTADTPTRKENQKDPKATLDDIVARVNALHARTQPGESPYLVGRGLTGYVLPVLKDGKLFLTLKNAEGEIRGATFISPNGDKANLKGSHKKGAFFSLEPLPQAPEYLLIAEGLATAITVGQCHAGHVIVALDHGNLQPVAVALREVYPQARIIIAADNDIYPDGLPNNGKLKAESAAKEVNGQMALTPTEDKADWDDYRQRHGIEATKQAFLASLTQRTEDTLTRRPELHQMAPNQIAEIMAKRYGMVRTDPETGVIYRYSNAVWEVIPDYRLMRDTSALFSENKTPFGQGKIKNTVETLRLTLEEIGEQSSGLIGFANCIYDRDKREFRQHSPDNWLRTHNGIVYTEAAPNETLAQHAPAYHRWLSHAAHEQAERMARIEAALFMVLANRYDWQLFIEVTGEGGSGKSIFAGIATMLAGEHNTEPGDMEMLDSRRERAPLFGKSLIVLPDQTQYVGSGSGLKAITGGDRVSIDPKHMKPFSAVIKAVVLVTCNEPMKFTENNGGIARRRVIFPFNRQVDDSQKDPDLLNKIAAELPVIIRHLLNTFADQKKAKSLLLEQRNSSEAMTVKAGSNPLYGFCGYLMNIEDVRDGMGMGHAGITPEEPRLYIYHAYLAFMDAQHSRRYAMTLNRFVEGLRSVTKEMGLNLVEHRFTKGKRYTVTLKEESTEWLPSVPARKT